MIFADMHIHSKYSDGSLTPEEIVRTARGNGVGLISVCDHNVIEGSIETEKYALEAGLKYLRGVEIDAIFEGRDIHILCYGADFSNQPLLDSIRRARAILDGMSAELLRRMTRDYPRLSASDYDAFTHDTKKGGWKMLQYLAARGITGSLKEGFPYYEKYGVTYEEAGFESAERIVELIHAAGGKAVLAHPGVNFSTESISGFEKQLEAALETGLDGVECHYVRHTPGVTRKCIEVCSRRDLMITAGSDCHGAFNNNEIGQTRTPIDALKLSGLV